MTDEWNAKPPVGPFAIGSLEWPGIAKLAEECGELVQVIGKIMGMHGVENYQHWDQTNVCERLELEMGDVKAAMAYVLSANCEKIDSKEVVARSDFKLSRFFKWHKQVRKAISDAATAK